MAGCGCLHALGGKQILHANRHTRHAAQFLASGTVSIDGIGSLQRFLRRGDDKGVELARGGNIGVERLGHFARGEIARFHAIADRGNAEFS